LGKPKGRYITVTIPSLRPHDQEGFENSVRAMAKQLRKLLPKHAKSVLVAGLGNKRITPDAVGPLTIENTMVTRHLVERHPDLFGMLRPVSALVPGVLATTGIESANIIGSVVKESKPDCLIVVDALASRKISRLCKTLQLCDTGIVPGSGVGNARAALNEETLGLPVIAVGVPTVVDAGTLCADLLEEAEREPVEPASLRDYGGDLIVTPKDIDALVKEVSRIVGMGISLALQEALTLAEVRGYVG